MCEASAGADAIIMHAAFDRNSYLAISWVALAALRVGPRRENARGGAILFFNDQAPGLRGLGIYHRGIACLKE